MTVDNLSYKLPRLLKTFFAPRHAYVNEFFSSRDSKAPASSNSFTDAMSGFSPDQRFQYRGSSQANSLSLVFVTSHNIEETRNFVCTSIWLEDLLLSFRYEIANVNKPNMGLTFVNDTHTFVINLCTFLYFCFTVFFFMKKKKKNQHLLFLMIIIISPELAWREHIPLNIRSE